MQTRCVLQRAAAFVLGAVGVCYITVFPMSSSCATATSDRLAFRTAEDGGFEFDTGVLRGKLRPKGRSLGLSAVRHVPSGLVLDRGEGGYGLFSHYRVFSRNKRYGTAAWDWPSTASLRGDGAAEVRWAADASRPFRMQAVYRWVAPDTLDLETIVEAQADLPGFESFLASYFQERFTNCLVYVSEPPQKPGKPAFLAAEKALGAWQMFPREPAVVPLIEDGRWRLEPHPVQWTIMPTLASPIAVRRDPASGLSAALMSVGSDCFAIAMPYQTESHYSVYLSLFGHDLKAGETARARARLLVTSGFVEDKVLAAQRALASPGRP